MKKECVCLPDCLLRDTCPRRGLLPTLCTKQDVATTNTTLEAIDVENGRDTPLTLNHSPLNYYVRKIYSVLCMLPYFGALQYNL